MAFKEIRELRAETTTAIGGRNNKTGKNNPTSIEGYYLGANQVESKKARSGFAYIYIFQTAQGNVGVWGKTNLDRKMKGVEPGCMTRVSFDGMLETPNGSMYKYKVEVDSSNTVDMSLYAPTDAKAEEASGSSEVEEYQAETSLDAEEEAVDEVVVARPVAPKQPLQTPSAERQARVQALLNKGRSTNRNA